MPIVSRYFQGMTYDESDSIVWHAIFGRPMLVASTLAKTLHKYATTRTRFELEDMFGVGFIKNTETAGTVKALIDTRILLTKYDPFIGYDDQEKLDIQDTFTSRNLRKNKIKSLSLIMSEECPSKCRHCIHSSGVHHTYGFEKMMSLEMAKASIDSYLGVVKANHLREANISFGGGEPLLNWQTIEKLLPYISQYRKQLGIPINVKINTNLAFLNRGIAKTLIKYSVEVNTSLDGIKKSNDITYLVKNPYGVCNNIIQGMAAMRNLGHSLDNLTVSITENNFSNVDTSIIDWAALRGMRTLRIDINVARDVRAPIDKIVDKLISIREYGKSKGVSVTGLWSYPAENLWLPPEDIDTGFCDSERGDAICVAPTGLVFPCCYSNYCLGRYTEIPTIYENTQYVDFMNNRSPLNLSRCQNCPILGFCRGGCLVDREVYKDTPEKLSRKCELYLAMTYEILRESINNHSLH